MNSRHSHSQLVSVIVPVYRAEKYIAKCIESILVQTHSALELILVDDGSPDRSGVICDEYAAKDRRIRVLHTPNRGVSHARNTGIDNAVGEYLFFVDSDDCISPEYIEDLLPIDGEDLVRGGCTNVVAGEIIDRFCYVPHVTGRLQWIENFSDSWAQGVITPPWGNCYKREIIEKYHIRFHTDIDISEDEIFNLEFLKHCNCVRYTDKCGYFYTVGRDGSLMNRHHTCRTLSVMKVAQAKECITKKREYHIRWNEWHTAIEHHRKWMKISRGDKKKEVIRCLRDTYRNDYFRESIPHIRKNGTLDEKVETFFMNRFTHPMYPVFYKIIVFISRLKRHLPIDGHDAKKG